MKPRKDLEKLLKRSVPENIKVQNGSGTCAPLIVFFDSDYGEGSRNCGLNVSAKHANGPVTAYVRADILKSLEDERNESEEYASQFQDVYLEKVYEIQRTRTERDELKVKLHNINYRREWSLIETAPRDGTTIDVWSPRVGRETNVIWLEDMEKDYASRIGHQWVSIDPYYMRIRGVIWEKPTHWMLPPPPPKE